MKKKIQDTHPKIEKMIIEGYRKMTPQQKLQKVSELNKSIQQIADVFQNLKIHYMIGGSLASSLHGIPRATQRIRRHDVTSAH
jgi:hypothetical protein